MGQAKRRGSYEERKGLAREKVLTLWERAKAPVDPETFLFVMNTAAAASTGKMPGVDTEKHQVKFVEGPEEVLVKFANNPINRAMAAMIEQLRDMGIEDSVPYTMRVMHAYQVYQSDKFAEFFIAGPEGEGTLQVNNALLSAMAVTPFLADPQNEVLGYDLDAVLENARRIAAADV